MIALISATPIAAVVIRAIGGITETSKTTGVDTCQVLNTLGGLE